MAASSSTVKVDVGSFAEDDFDVKAWVNNALAARYADQQPSRLENGFSRLAEEKAADVEEGFL